MKNPRWPPLVSKNQVSAIFTNDEYKKKKKSMSFVVSNPWERAEYRISLKEI